ncbi:50S ribosome-binding GTPase [bacterium]|nr:50S ribosome-binding GTPase [bacterium]
MPANLPPQFFALLAKLKEAESPEEKISILEEMLAICPKHKGTEKVQRDLKSKIAKLKKQKPQKTKRETLYSIPKQGAGQIIIVGPANSGKSSLLNALSNAKAKLASYPFTTSTPQPAMMKYENILIQLVDTPPLTKESPGWLKALMSAADGLIVVFDLAKNEITEEIKNLKEILNNWGLENKKILFLGNKIDLPKAKENFQKLKDKICPISAQNKMGIEELKKEIFNLLEIARIYSKKPGKEIDFEHPFIVKKGTKLIKLAKEISEDLVSSFKYAKLFRKNSSKVQIVGKDYLLKDQDIIEIHT